MHEPFFVVAVRVVDARLRAARFRPVERAERDRLGDVDEELRFEQPDEIGY